MTTAREQPAHHVARYGGWWVCRGLAQYLLYQRALGAMLYPNRRRAMWEWGRWAWGSILAADGKLAGPARDDVRDERAVTPLAAS